MRNRVAATFLSASIGLIVMLAAVSVVLIATLAVTTVHNRLLQAVSLAAQFIIGVGLLVGSVYIATRFAVRVSGKSSDS
ncbi:MAG: hypothetical protein ACRD4K_03485 [Candidatus Acidiferrales bacterium]